MNKFDNIVESVLTENKKVDISIIEPLMKLLKQKKFDVIIDKSNLVDSLANIEIGNDMVDVYGYIDRIKGEKKLGIAISWIKGDKDGIDTIIPIPDNYDIHDIYNDISNIIKSKGIII